MKAKLLKKLRQEIIKNTDIHWYSQWSGYLTTELQGEIYHGKRHSPIGLSSPDIAGRELEHIALEGYMTSKRNKL